MTIVLISNYLNHHSLPLCKALSKLTNNNFYFVATKTVSDERKSLGYKDINSLYDFVVPLYESEHTERAIQLCLTCDVMLFGIAPEPIVKHRLKLTKLTFKYSERVYKKNCPWYEIPLRAVKYFFQYTIHKNLYLLCASAYTAGDYAKTGTFLNKAFKWGYFPETKKYDIDELISKKQKNSLLWVGRMLDWKHPETAIEIARRLKNDGFEFTLNIIGSGDMYDELEDSIAKYNLKENVNLLGSMPPEKVREYMEQSEIYLMTSDRNEGWGAVVNEAMNSGCAVVANCEAGSVPFLIKDRKNGFLYSKYTLEDMYSSVKYLLSNKQECNTIQKNAYATISKDWNAETAAKRLVELCEHLLKGNKNTTPFEDGVCSLALVLKDN